MGGGWYGGGRVPRGLQRVNSLGSHMLGCQGNSLGSTNMWG